MHRIAPWRMGCVLLVCAAVGGCIHDRVVVIREVAPLASVPLALGGEDTRLRITFPQSTQNVRPGNFERDEICYLKAGDFRIDCYADGSSLNLGPTDSTALLSDNPMWGVEPIGAEKASGQYMKLCGVLFLVGASVERLPQTLADYLGEPGTHEAEAVALTRLLLNQKRLQFQGYARGGGFNVAVELTDAGRDKLLDALDEAGESTGPTQWVSSGSISSCSPPTPAMTELSDRRPHPPGRPRLK